MKGQLCLGTDHVRSTREGNVFKGVCLYVHTGEGSVYLLSRFCPGRSCPDPVGGRRGGTSCPDPVQREGQGTLKE